MFKSFVLLFLTLPFMVNSQDAQGLDLVYTSPVHMSKFHHPSTRLVLKSANKIDVDFLDNFISFELVGNVSGIHSFNTVFSNDKYSICLIPETPFVYNELVSLKVTKNGSLLNELIFETCDKKAIFTKKEDSETINLQAKGYADFTVNVNNNPSSENIFFKLNAPQNSDKTVNIFTNNAHPIFSENWGPIGFDFKVNENNLLTYFEGPSSSWKIMDSFMNVVDSISCVNGYSADRHEFMAYPNGRYFLMAYDEQPYAMDTVVAGGDPNAMVEGLIIQEFDAAHNLVFQWRSWDYFQITDNIYLDLTLNILDYVHGNAMHLDDDGHLLVSCRALDEITKINLNNGSLIWRWGGSQNEFNFANDYPFTHQHCIRSLGNSRYLLYDNGNYSAQYTGIGNVSRGVEYVLDTTTMSATKVNEFIHPDLIYGKATGSIQRLPNGNTFINWGNLFDQTLGPRLSEFDPSGQLIFDLEYPAGHSIYRAHKFNWFFDSSIVGCTDNLALNYNANALVFDSTCIYSSYNCVNGLCEDPLDGSGTYSDLTTCQLNCSGLMVDELFAQVSIYPNPSAAEINVVSTLEVVSYCIVDLNGEVISQQKVNATAFRINKQHLSNGVYFLELSTAKSRIIKRIVFNDL